MKIYETREDFIYLITYISSNGSPHVCNQRWGPNPLPLQHTDLGKCCTIGVAIEATKTKVILSGFRHRIHLHTPKVLGKMIGSFSIGQEMLVP